MMTTTWEPNRWDGERRGEHYVGKTPKGFWRLWTGQVIRPEIFTTKKDAKAFAEALDKETAA